MTNLECNLCELRSGCRFPLTSVKFVSEGLNTKDLLFCVVDRPTLEEDYLETPFSDRANMYFRSLLYPVFHKNVYLAYATKCYNKKTDAELKNIGITCVNNYLRKEIEKENPKAVLALGKYSHHTLIRARWNNNTHAKDINSIYVGDRLWATHYSPSYFLSRGKAESLKFQEFLRKLKTTMESFNV